MSIFRQILLAMPIAVVGVTGCETTSPRHAASLAPPPSRRLDAAPGAAAPAVTTASHVEPAEVPPANTNIRPTVNDGLAAADRAVRFTSDETGSALITLDSLVAEVLEVNPSLNAMLSAWSAAAEKYPQVIALDDPMLMYMVAPATYSSSSAVPESWTIQLSQKIPWPGKRDWRSQIAAWEAHASGWDVETTRRQLAATAKLAYFDYLLVHDQLRLNDESLKLVQKVHELAKSKFENNLGSLQDMLQAEVEIGARRLRAVELEQMRSVAAGRINTLRHRPAAAPVPPPAKVDEAGGPIPSLELLTRTAIEQHPELASKSARLAAEQAAVELAAKEFWPDVDLFARYDTMWMDREQQVAVGFSLNLPVQRARRRAAVSEAVGRVNQRCHELQSQTDQVRFEVQSAVAKLDESRRSLEVYHRDILPAAERNVSAANAAYEANTAGLLPLIEAQRQLIAYREKALEAAAEYHRRLAELERVVGRVAR
jgi:outer membrane protein TolC